MRVIVTAGASGIGRAMAEKFLFEGAQVAICDVDEIALADFSTAYPDAIAITASVAEAQQVDAFFDQVETAFGGIDVVCANAGTGGPAAAKWAVDGHTETLAPCTGEAILFRDN